VGHSICHETSALPSPCDADCEKDSKMISTQVELSVRIKSI
jgi:hypothetical protein